MEEAYRTCLSDLPGNRYITVVATVASGISYLGAPFVIPLIKRHRRYQHAIISLSCKSSCQLVISETLNLVCNLLSLLISAWALCIAGIALA